MNEIAITREASRFTADLGNGRRIVFRYPTIRRFQKIMSDYENKLKAANDANDRMAYLPAMTELQDAQIITWSGIKSDDPELLAQLNLPTEQEQEIPYQKGMLDAVLLTDEFNKIFNAFTVEISPGGSGNSGSPAPSAQASSAVSAPAPVVAA